MVRFIQKLCLPIALFLGLGHSFARDASDVDQVVREVHHAYSSFDFESVAENTHEKSLKVFRRIIGLIVDRCVVEYGEETVFAVLDLPDGLSQLEKYDDRDYFAHVMECAALSLPERRHVDIEITGVEEREGEIVCVTYKVPRRVMAAPHFNLYSNGLRELKKENGRWYARGTPIRLVEKYVKRSCKALAGGGCFDEVRDK